MANVYLEKICDNCKGHGYFIISIFCKRSENWQVRKIQSECNVCNGNGFDITTMPIIKLDEYI